MNDIIKERATRVYDNGTAYYHGTGDLVEGRYVTMVHNEPLTIGEIFKDGDVITKVCRQITLEDFMRYSPQVPIIALDTDKCFFYLVEAD